jgi:hypothetical protein
MRTSRKTAAGVAAMALLGGLAAGCSGANGTVSVNPKPSATSRQAPVPDTPAPAQPSKYTGDPNMDALTWMAGSGYAALTKVNTDMAAMPNDPSQWTGAQYRTVVADIKTAQADPIPASVDPHGHYARFLGSVGQAVRDAENGYLEGTIHQAGQAATEWKGLADELDARELNG